MDKLIFGHNPELLSVIGSSMILGSAIYVAIQKAGVPHKPVEAIGNADEERGLVQGMDDGDDEAEEIPMREVRTGQLEI